VLQWRKLSGFARVNKISPCSWDTHYQFSFKTFKTQERKKDVIAKEIPVGNGPGQFLGSYVINRVLTTRLVQ